MNIDGGYGQERLYLPRDLRIIRDEAEVYVRAFSAGLVRIRTEKEQAVKRPFHFLDPFVDEPDVFVPEQFPLPYLLNFNDFAGIHVMKRAYVGVSVLRHCYQSLFL